MTGASSLDDPVTRTAKFSILDLRAAELPTGSFGQGSATLILLSVIVETSMTSTQRPEAVDEHLLLRGKRKLAADKNSRLYLVAHTSSVCVAGGALSLGLGFERH